MSKIKKIFGKEHGIIIGAVHFPPLLGYPDFPGFGVAEKNASMDVGALVRGNVNGIIFENNYDLPHKEHVDSSVAISMALLGERIKESTKLPVGASVLWNDYKTALSLAKVLDLKFVRIPVFVDTVKTAYGTMHGRAKAVTSYRKLLDAERVALFVDIHVKHSKILSKYSLVESARRAIRAGADALVITGKWTGDPPEQAQLLQLRKAIGRFPVFAGSGVDARNIAGILKFVNGVIVSTSLKKGGKKRKHVNLKAYAQRIDPAAVKALVRASRVS